MPDLRLASHRRFQIAVLLLVLAGTCWALALVAFRLPAVALTAGEAVLALGLAYTAQGPERSRSLRVLLAAPVLLACLLAAACFLPWTLRTSSALLVVGPLQGLVTSLGLLPAHLVRRVPDRIEIALATLGAGADSATRALAERAQAAFRQLEARLRRNPGAESRRLVQLAEGGTLQACALAHRCHELRAEMATMGQTVREERQVHLQARLAATSDPDARRSLQAACAEARVIDERASALARAGERIEARLELQVTLLEGTALAVVLRRASEEAGEAALFAPLSERLRDAASDLQAEAQALAELGV